MNRKHSVMVFSPSHNSTSIFHVQSIPDPENQHNYLRYCPHTVTAHNRATTEGLICLYYEYCSTVTEWGQYPLHTLLSLLKDSTEVS